ncbi:MAG: alpha/beta hydrolase [Tatlockia sp.]|nr:alpha/beta hydrolase [Tatlockia sp.]
MSNTTFKWFYRLSLLLITLFLNQTLATAKPNSLDFAKTFDIGKGRQVYLRCSGSGAPTVIMESGYRNNSDVWTVSVEGKKAIFPAVASYTRVCVYDRPGTIGWTVNALSRSDQITMPRSADSVVTDLHDVLQAAKLKGPFILVGHSLGGIFTRLFASKYPNEVEGLILVDAYPESFKSLLGPKKWAAYLKITGLAVPGIKDPNHFENIDFDQVTSVMEDTAVKSPLKPMPLIVLSRGLPTDLPVPNDPELTSVAFEQAWQKGQNKLVLLEPHAKHLIATKSQHYIQYAQPDLIIDAIHQMVEDIRKNKNKKAG